MEQVANPPKLEMQTDTQLQNPPALNNILQKRAIFPAPGEVITSLATGNTYTIGEKIGEGNFGTVFSCKDVWENDLAAKVLKPIGSNDEKVKAMAEAEFVKLLLASKIHIYNFRL